MAEQIDFDDWGETDLDTLDGSRPRAAPGAADNAMKRQAYAGNRIMLRPDGTPIPNEVPAQLRQPQRPQPPPQQQRSEVEYVDQAFEALAQPPQARSLEETFSEAERRFEKAKYYKLLLAQPIFSDSSVVGQEVETEVRAFVQERFEVFLGMRQERTASAPVPAAFEGWDKGDFEALLVMIRRIRERPELVAAAKATAPAAEPSITPRAPPEVAVAKEPSLRPRAPTGASPVVNTPATAKLGQNPPLNKNAKPAKGPRQRKLKPLVDPYTGQPVVDPVTGQQLMKDITPQVRPPPGAEQPIPMQIGKDAVAAIHATKANEAAANLEQRLARGGEKGMIVRTAATYASHTDLGGVVEGQVIYEGQDYVPDASLMTATDGEGGRGISRN
jgi:hypothetical protein